jgi:hypothetical protein
MPPKQSSVELHASPFPTFTEQAPDPLSHIPLAQAVFSAQQ